MAGAGSRIVVAERWPILRRGLSGLLHGPHIVVEEVDDVSQLGAILARRPVDLAVAGDGPGVDLIAVTTALCAQHPDTRLAVLCERLDGEQLRALLHAGAHGVLSKRLDDDTLLDSVARLLRGERVIDQRFLPLLFNATDAAEPGCDGEPMLTAREHDVLLELARGASNREIAEALVVGEATVKSHLGRIYAKLEVDGRHRAVGRAVELGLLT
jgi:DNA-binding NarL/FixJ family response regulator